MSVKLIFISPEQNSSLHEIRKQRFDRSDCSMQIIVFFVCVHIQWNALIFCLLIKIYSLSYAVSEKKIALLSKHQLDFCYSAVLNGKTLGLFNADIPKWKHFFLVRVYAVLFRGATEQLCDDFSPKAL